MTRLKAAGIHLLLSALVVSCVLLLLLLVWYPDGFFTLLGASQLVYLVAFVDVTLGPLLTFVVFNTAKKSLKFDLTVIVALQLAALLYGVSVMFGSRPVFNVLEEDMFKVTLASDFKDNQALLKAKDPKWQRLPWFGPLLVAAVAPTDVKEQQEIIFAAASGLDWNVFPQLFVEYDTQRDAVLKHAKPLAILKASSPENARVVEAFLRRAKKPISAFVYLPIVQGYTAMTAVLDANNADFIQIIAADTP